MRVSQLLQAFRIRVDDRTEDYLWPDDWFIAALNEAMDEACIRAKLLTDSNTPDVCHLAVVADQTVYPLDPRVIDVLQVRLDTSRCTLDRMGYEQMIYLQATSNGSSGMPIGYAIEGMPETGLKLLLDRPIDPVAYATLRMTVERKQLQELRLPVTGPSPIDDTPEINASLHRKLLHWVAHLAYDTRDGDAQAPQLSAVAEAKFDAAFGIRQSAKNEKIRLRHHAIVVRGEDRVRSVRRIRPYRPFVDPS